MFAFPSRVCLSPFTLYPYHRSSTHSVGRLGGLRWRFSCRHCSSSWRPSRSSWRSCGWSVGSVPPPPEFQPLLRAGACSREWQGSGLLGAVDSGSGLWSNSRLHGCQLVDQATEHVVLREQVLLDLHCLMEHGIGIVVG